MPQAVVNLYICKIIVYIVLPLRIFNGTNLLDQTAVARFQRNEKDTVHNLCQIHLPGCGRINVPRKRIARGRRRPAATGQHNPSPKYHQKLLDIHISTYYKTMYRIFGRIMQR